MSKFPSGRQAALALAAVGVFGPVQQADARYTIQAKAAANCSVSATVKNPTISSTPNRFGYYTIAIGYTFSVKNCGDTSTFVTTQPWQNGLLRKRAWVDLYSEPAALEPQSAWRVQNFLLTRLLYCKPNPKRRLYRYWMTLTVDVYEPGPGKLLKRQKFDSKAVPFGDCSVLSSPA